MTGAAVALRGRARLHPEWPLVVVAVSAWVALAVPWPTGPGSMGHWVVMSAAMTLPAVLPGARRMALTGLWRWRHRAVVLFAAAQLVVWAAAGVVAVPVGALVRTTAGRFTPVVTAAVLLLAAAFELTHAKQRALRAGHRIAVVAPAGRAVVAGLLREGARHGGWCVRSCGVLMAAPAVAGHGGLLLMLALTGVVVVQKLARQPTRYAGTAAVVLTGAAALAVT